MLKSSSCSFSPARRRRLDATSRIGVPRPESSIIARARSTIRTGSPISTTTRRRRAPLGARFQTSDPEADDHWTASGMGLRAVNRSSVTVTGLPPPSICGGRSAQTLPEEPITFSEAHRRVLGRRTSRRGRELRYSARRLGGARSRSREPTACRSRHPKRRAPVSPATLRDTLVAIALLRTASTGYASIKPHVLCSGRVED